MRALGIRGSQKEPIYIWFTADMQKLRAQLHWTLHRGHYLFWFAAASFIYQLDPGHQVVPDRHWSCDIFAGSRRQYSDRAPARSRPDNASKAAHCFT